MTKIQKDWAWSIIIMALMTVFFVKCGTPAHAKSSDTYYEVKVRYQMGGCYGYKTVTVPARSSFDAKDKAERVVQYNMEVSAQSVREVK
jgi:hypothetical protein